MSVFNIPLDSVEDDVDFGASVDVEMERLHPEGVRVQMTEHPLHPTNIICSANIASGSMRVSFTLRRTK